MSSFFHLFVKTGGIILLLFLCNGYAAAQTSPDSVKIITVSADSTIITDTTDTRPRNSYGDLLDDDPKYNPRSSFVVPLLRVTTANVFGWAWLRYVAKASYTKVSLQSWKANLRGQWEWDRDDFGTNFLSHPQAGSDYFNAARSNGYNYFGSMAYTLVGSLEWEYFAEIDRPSKNDLINTPLSGAFLGEIMYRISSNILDDRRRGKARVSREIFAALINPSRGLNRLTQGRMWRVTPYDVYQQEPLNVTVQVGAHRVNENTKTGTGSTNAVINLQLDYGDPFEIRKRKPFDVFRVRFESRYGEDKKFVDNVLGYGLLTGRTRKTNRSATLLGIFQHYDYWSNKVFELGTLGFGPGVISKIRLGNTSHLYSGLHVAAVPMAGNSTRFGPDTSEFRDYSFGGGFEGRIEERFNFGKIFSLGFNGYYYWIWNYEGSSGKSRIGILKPFITVHLFRGLSLGLEHHIYYDNRFLDPSTGSGLSELHLTTTEQKVFLQVFFEDRKRYGKYH